MTAVAANTLATDATEKSVVSAFTGLFRSMSARP
jgi:hypothetical protein